ncbi:MAG: hypothetical protein GF332_02260 [Candidatus Moranbacteria bacterium]|nr:hypothetical protein [Candidatus Moranbacteria bacterium]
MSSKHEQPEELKDPEIEKLEQRLRKLDEQIKNYTNLIKNNEQEIQEINDKLKNKVIDINKGELFIRKKAVLIELNEYYANEIINLEKQRKELGSQLEGLLNATVKNSEVIDFCSDGSKKELIEKRLKQIQAQIDQLNNDIAFLKSSLELRNIKLLDLELSRLRTRGQGTESAPSHQTDKGPKDSSKVIVLEDKKLEKAKETVEELKRAIKIKERSINILLRRIEVLVKKRDRLLAEQF